LNYIAFSTEDYSRRLPIAIYMMNLYCVTLV